MCNNILQAYRLSGCKAWDERDSPIFFFFNIKITPRCTPTNTETKEMAAKKSIKLFKKNQSGFLKEEKNRFEFKKKKTQILKIVSCLNIMSIGIFFTQAYIVSRSIYYYNFYCEYITITVKIGTLFQDCH